MWRLVTNTPPEIELISIAVTVNSEESRAEVEPRLLLVDFFRETLNLTGTHIGCDTSYCGACTVLLDGLAVKSCTVLAVQADGREVTTVEGLARQNAPLHPVQQAFADNHGLQCGYCTPGFLMSVCQLLSKNPNPDDRAIRKAIAGNTCRCTGYQNIFKAIRAAASTMREIAQP